MQKGIYRRDAENAENAEVRRGSQRFAEVRRGSQRFAESINHIFSFLPLSFVSLRSLRLCGEDIRFLEASQEP